MTPSLNPSEAVNVTIGRGPSLDQFSQWTLRFLVVACTTVLVGLIWDISWHMTIGRDTFWTPAHIFIYLGGAISGLASGALAIKTTFFSTEIEKRASVGLWGGRAPLGAWLAIWGSVAMITSGPFDDWWHNAYGLDVKIISPPHILLFSGMIFIVFGALILALHEQNNQSARTRSAAGILSYVGGNVITFLALLFFSEGWPNHQHSAYFYFVSSCVYPLILVAVARASTAKWAATKAALSYLAVTLAMVWLLPRFAAQPKLGPVFNPVDHMVPPYFPHLLFVPALAVDYIKQREWLGRGWIQDWLFALLLGSAFVIIFIITQWFFSAFLISPAAANPVFAGGQSAPYYSAHAERRDFFWETGDLFRLHSIVKIFFCAIVSSRAGLAVGTWMRKVRR